MHRGSGWLSEEHLVSHPCQTVATDLISVAGHSTWAAPNTYRGSMFSYFLRGEQWPPQRPRPRNTSVPSCRSSQRDGLYPETLLVSVRLGGGAATRRLMTSHRADERERASNHGLWLRALRPATSAQSMLYIRKESAKGSALHAPVRRQARSLPSTVTRSQSG